MCCAWTQTAVEKEESLLDTLNFLENFVSSDS